MAVLCFDEAHAETWTIDRELAASLTPVNPEYNYFGHLAELTGEVLGTTAVRQVRTWDREFLRDVDVLVIAVPASPTVENGCGGRPVFSADEIEQIRDFVIGGGGLLVIGEYDIDRWGSNLNEVLAFSGIAFNNDTLRTQRDAERPFLLSRHFECSDVSEHAASCGLSAITFHRGCSLRSESREAQVLIRAPAGEAVVVVAEIGRGRVAAIGDSDLFSLPFVGHADNAQLWINLVGWLQGDGDTATRISSVQGLVRDRSYRLRRDPLTALDLRGISGDHIFDAHPFLSQLERLCANLADPYVEQERFLLDAELAFHELPREMRQAIVEFRRRSNEYGALLLTGLPQDPILPATPSDSRRSTEKRTYRSEFWLSVLGAAVGDPMAYSQEKDGELFQVVAPTKQKESLLSSESSKTLLDFHTETAFHPFMPDYVLLYCLRSDHRCYAKTIVTSVRVVAQELPLRYRSVLFEHAFQTGIDESFGSRNATKGNGPVLPVFHGNHYDPLMKCDLDLMIGLHADAQQALACLGLAVNKCLRFVRLQPGELLLIDNRRAVHGRTEFEALYDGNDRWLQRMYVSRDLELAEQDRYKNERIIDTLFRV